MRGGVSSVPPSGRVVMGRYRIVRRLATGGMGIVYLARIEGAEGFARPAVIKRMLPDLTSDEELVQLFVREAQILAGLRHPGVVSVLDFSIEQDAYLMALEYVHGYHVGRWLKFLARADRELEWELAVYIVVCVCDALHYVHTRVDEKGESLGIIHRDVTPSNILIDLEGHVRLLDFGVARTAAEVTSTREGEVSLKGKFAYLAPELLQHRQPSVRSDVYACGIVLHELLVGENEFRSRDPSETLRRVLLHDLTDVRDKREDVPEAIDTVIARATARAPDVRTESAAELARQLRGLLVTPENELGQGLRDAVNIDFRGPLPESLHLPTLDELEQAWRNPPPSEGAITQDIPIYVDEEPADRPGIGWGAKAGIALLAIAALGGLGLGAYAILRAPATSAGPVVVVERENLANPRETEAPEEGESVPDASVSEPEIADARMVARPTAHERGPRDEAAALSRRFNRRRAALSACFEQHTHGTEGRPQLSIRFSIDRRGSVTEAELAPAAIASTPLGRCLVGVARSTQFGRRAEPLSFRIPITVRGE